MAIQGWGVSNYLQRLSQVIDTYPFIVAAWANRASTSGNRTIVHIGTGTASDQRRAQLRINTANTINAANFDTVTFDQATSSTTSSQNTWFLAGGEYISTTSRAALLNGGGRGTNASSINPSSSDRIYVGALAVGNETMGSTDGIAEISLWDAAGMTSGNMDSLLGKLFNGGAGGAGGNPVLINAESSQPWTGKLSAYWPLTSTSDLADASGNGKTLSIAGSLSNFGSHPNIEPLATNTSIQPFTMQKGA